MARCAPCAPTSRSPTPSPTPRELALLGWVDIVAGTGPVADSARAAVRGHWAAHEVVELTALVGTTLLLNRFATALAVPTGPDTMSRLATEGLS